jgi:hypothetical protein
MNKDRRAGYGKGVFGGGRDDAAHAQTREKRLKWDAVPIFPRNVILFPSEKLTNLLQRFQVESPRIWRADF